MTDTTHPRTITIEQDDLALLFTEWDAAYRANPEAFANETRRLLTTTPADYGPRAAATLLSILDGDLTVESVLAQAGRQILEHARPTPTLARIMARGAG